MARPLQVAKIVLPLLVYLQAAVALAQDAPIPIANKHLLNSAVRLQITPRGMKYFDHRLGDVLGNLGVKLDEGYFPAMKFMSDKDLNPGDFADSQPDTVKIYEELKNFLSHWLVGFSLNNHRPVVEIGESGYEAKFSRFGLVTDEKLMRDLGKRDGAILAVEMSVEKITIATTSAVAWDMNNEFLGRVGLENLVLDGGNKETPLKIRLPFYVHMNSSGGLNFEFFEIDNNLNETPLTLKYGKLISPTFAIEINEKKFFLNNDQLDRFIQAKAPLILQKIRENLGTFARTQLPRILNEKANQFLSGTLEQVQDLTPPNDDPKDHRPHFKWGMQLQKINLKTSLNVDLGAYIEDLTNPNSSPLRSHGSRGDPQFELVPMDQFDIGLSIDRSLINRVLQLSFERRNFENIPQSDGSVLRLRATPLIDYISPPAGVALGNNETFVKLRVAVEHEPKSIFLKEKIVLEFDIVAKLRQLSHNRGMQMVLSAIDLDSLFLDDKYFSWAGRLFKGKVRQGVRAELKKKSDAWKSGNETIPGSLPLPPEILGLKLNINRVTMDPRGHLVMYLNYANTGAKK